MVLFLAGKPWNPVKLHKGKFRVQGWQTSCCMYHLQMPSTLACFWIREDCYFWSCNWSHKRCSQGKIVRRPHLFCYSQQTFHLWKPIGLIFLFLFLFQAKEADGRLPYWLSNTSALLCLLQKNLRSNGFFGTPSRRSAGGLGGKLAQVRNWACQSILLWKLVYAEESFWNWVLFGYGHSYARI